MVETHAELRAQGSANGTAGTAGTAEDKLALLRAEYARLAAAARASVAAFWAGAANPLAYVEAELIRHRGLPSRGSAVMVVLADARTAMTMADRAERGCRRSGRVVEFGRRDQRTDAAAGPEAKAQQPLAEHGGHRVRVMAQPLEQLLG
jgi:hypothetical protein